MGSAKDNTQSFKECVRAAALKQGMDEAKVVKLTDSLIMPKAMERSSFLNAAIETMKSITTLQTFVLLRQKDYTDQHRSTEKDRDSIEHEVGMFVKTCRERIDFLKNSIGNEEVTGHPKWLSGLIGNAGSADMVAHQHGVVLILSERLHSVTVLFDRFRAARFQEAIEKSVPRWRKGATSKQQSVAWNDNQETISEEPPPIQTPPVQDMKQVMLEDETRALQTPPVQDMKQVMLEDETRALQVELTNLLDTAQETERKMIEVSTLNHLFSTHVLHQAQQIELLYEQALDATENVQKGNREIRKAIDRNSSNRTFLILFLLVLPLAVLFLHWYN